MSIYYDYLKYEGKDMSKQKKLFTYMTYKAVTIIGFTLAINELLFQEDGKLFLGYAMIVVGLIGTLLSTHFDIKEKTPFCKGSFLKEILVLIILVSFGIDILSLFNAFMQREYMLDGMFASLGFFIVAVAGCLFISQKEEV